MDDLVNLFVPRMLEAMRKLGEDTKLMIQDSLSTQGQVRPEFIVSAPGQPPYNFDGRMIDGITFTVTQPDAATIRLTMISNAWGDQHDGPPKNFAADEEGGHFWDGWVQDFERGYEWVHIAPPHWVEPRPYMKPAAEHMAASGAGYFKDYFNQSSG